MKTTLKSWLVVICLVLGALTAALAQNNKNDKIQVPLSQPNKPGSLRTNLLNGSISVSGYNGKDVIISYGTRDGNEKNKSSTRENEEANGLRQLNNNSTGLEVREENNVVTIKASSFNHTIDLQIQVPSDFSVKLKTLNSGVITVEEVNGELEVDNLNGNINLKNVTGSASASTLNGDIVANFKKVMPNMPMAFSSLNGKIDVTLPAAAKFNVKLKSDNGQIFTDYDMAMEKGNQFAMPDKGNSLMPSQLRNNNSPTLGTRIYVDKWLYGKMNGGGPEILFKNFNGNIYIRKSK